MKKILSLFKRITTPLHLTLEHGLIFWQEKVLLNLLLVTVIFGFFTYIPSLALALREKLWVIAIVDTLIYFFIILLFIRRNLSFKIRAIGIPLISYILGLVLLSTLGPFGAGPVWLFFFPIITGILLGQKASFLALAINLSTITGLGVIIHYRLTDFLVSFNFKAWYLAMENPVEKWIVISLNFILLNVVATLSLTTLMKGLQKSILAVAESEKKYRRIFENIPDVYFETNLEAKVLEVSPSIEKITLYTQDEIKGNSLFKIYKDLQQREETINLLLTNGRLKNHEIEFINKDGKVACCSINAELVKKDDGQPERVMGVLRDISEQKALEKEKKELEERLSRSQKMEALGLLAGGVAHDLNNILSGIVTYPEFLAMDLVPDDPLRKSLEIIQSSGIRAAEIVQDLLTLSRRGVITKDVVNFNDLILNFLHTPEYQKILSFHPCVRIEKDIAASFPFIRGSQVHLQKTVMNLISNAAEAQPGGRIIRIATSDRHLDKSLKGYDQVEKGDYIVLSVKDEGSGIEPEDLRRIFEPFFTKKVMGRSGTGLGMAVVWGTVQDHSGYIDIDSTPGKGTTFDLYFPVSKDLPINSPEPSRLDQIQGRGEKILIIDDVSEQRQIAEMLLQKLGYTTASAASGEEAIEYLKKNNADLLLLDMIMEPGMDGHETYKRILSFRPGQKAVIASGFSKTLQVNETLRLGAGQYLKKPYTIEKIGVAVRTALEKS
ncbi:MAG: ATP-binding protein [Desulfobacula sp.]|jgi:PAS domain S-box-containing protein